MDEIVALLQEIGVPFAYDHFEEGEAVDPPFLCYLVPSSDNFCADGKVYHKANVVHLELYTDEKSPELEQRVENELDSACIFYEREEVWIESERLYEVIYIFNKEA